MYEKRRLFRQVSPLPLADARDEGAQRMIANYSVSHHMVIEPCILLGLFAEYRSQRWV